MNSDLPPALILADVRAGYGRGPVLNGLSLTIAAGEAYALLGPNGAGKSTAVRVACGLLKPERGETILAGRRSGGRIDRGRVGLAPQECALFPLLTIRQNLFALAQLAGLGREAAAGVRQAMTAAECSVRADDVVATLSGGWRRRANLAAALVARPALLVLDEPTEGVDVMTRSALARAVRLATRDGAGCLMVSHDAAFVAEAADRVGVISRGRLVAEGSPSDLLRARFGRNGLLNVSFSSRPDDALYRTLSTAGLQSSDDGLAWRLIAPDATARALTLADAISASGGEMAIRRPGLDELVLALSEETAA
ncbi:ABC transporter ATP-binding protein [Brevundimonas sp. S30B]|uniref:ABC transporter ATP-binding protein n=1 Tax=unclassified Brevundimonas TaxID=2622653 RepID=UPI0010719001|nr:MULTISPECIES: ABC transporter ATP-binding protein [unclassified Brevundimonas]QBX37808.1 ABC transporter ATP-binding protein [Brevundimonas sp. MF30-B]TFW02836.1 ABC transporter ATP-binding protein [Brevundimonas sp. S30B]